MNGLKFEEMCQRGQIKDKTKITCVINSKTILDAKIKFEAGDIYICQNFADGSCPNDTLGYKKGWILDNGVSNIEILNEKNKTNKSNGNFRNLGREFNIKQ